MQRRSRRTARALVALALTFTLFVAGALAGGTGAGRAMAASAARITVIGDSLTVGTSGLAAALEADGWADARVDARVGRHISATGDVVMSGILTIRALRSEGWDTPDWIVALGTNDLGAFTSNSATATYLQRIVDEIGTGHRIAFVTLALPTYPAQSEIFNSVVRGWAATQPSRFVVVDWDRTALLHPEWFASDQIHLNSIGYSRRTTSVVNGVSAWRSTGGSSPDVGATTPIPVSVGRSAAGITVAANERVVDTRVGLGLPSRLTANNPVTIRLSDLTTVPTGTIAVVANLTTIGSASAGYLSAGRCAGLGSTSVQNFGRDDVVASLAIIDLDDTNAFCALASSPADLLVDIDGWLVDSGAPTVASAPTRIYDSRTGSRSTTHTMTVSLPPGATGAVVNITVDGPAAAGYVSAHECDHAVTGSNVNFSANETGSNLAIVAMSSDRLCIDASVPTHVIVDLVGAVVTGGASTVATTVATRVLDTRTGIGTVAGRATAGQTIVVNSALPSGTSAVFVQTTATGTLANGYLTAHDCSAGMPSTSNVNASTTVDRSNLALVAVDGGDLCVSSSNRTHVVADVVAVVRSA